MVIIEDLLPDKYGYGMAAYKCKCGKVVWCRKYSVESGNTASCGCSRQGHGMREDSAYHSWRGMKARCNNPNSTGYSRYGGRGITYDPKWETFEGFLSDMGSPGKGWTLDRVDNDGNYCQANCQWITRSDNAKKQWVDKEFN